MNSSVTKMIEEADKFEITPLLNGACRIQTPQGELIFSYEASYELAVQLARLIHSHSDDESMNESLH